MAGFPRRPLKAQACGRSRGQQRQNKGDEATKGAAVSYAVASEGKEKQEQNAKRDEEIFLRATTNDTFPKENRRRADGNCRKRESYQLYFTIGSLSDPLALVKCHVVLWSWEIPRTC